MTITTIKIQEDTKSFLDLFRDSISESYDEIIKIMVAIAKSAEKNPEKSQELMKEIAARRKRIAKGNFYSKEELKKRFNIPEPD